MPSESNIHLISNIDLFIPYLSNPFIHIIILISYDLKENNIFNSKLI